MKTKQVITAIKKKSMTTAVQMTGILKRKSRKRTIPAMKITQKRMMITAQKRMMTTAQKRMKRNEMITSGKIITLGKITTAKGKT
jgi:hypothetical protein